VHSIVLAVASDTAPFCEFLRAVHVQVCDVEGTTVRASIPGAQSDLHERRELSGYVVTWNALNPARRAEIVS
jgi:hypothetical protein